jgi:hypothetical protein
LKKKECPDKESHMHNKDMETRFDIFLVYYWKYLCKEEKFICNACNEITELPEDLVKHKC